MSTDLAGLTTNARFVDTLKPAAETAGFLFGLKTSKTKEKGREFRF
ncbi:hypothetical protein P9D31_17790 [Bacillus haynesii]|nr:hypothetical protein [Bacillus haynesii]MEC1474188.1 hypothetical protein [Bacillus haynesii]MEC1562642.1 hypothetical protein [Bacillus haynesii]